VKNFLKLVKNGAVSKSSQPAIGDLIDVFDESDEDTLGLFIGDGLSGGYQNAMGAKNTMDSSEHIHILDTKTLAGAERYLLEKAVRLRNDGLDIENIKLELQKSIDTSASFVIPADFEFLKRSGRLTPIAAKISSMIKIVPVLTQTEDMKKITILTVKRSNKKAVEAIIANLKKRGVDDSFVIYICHGGDEIAAKSVENQIATEFAGTDIEYMMLSPAMITHGGPDCVVVQAIKK